MLILNWNDIKPTWENDDLWEKHSTIATHKGKEESELFFRDSKR